MAETGSPFHRGEQAIQARLGVRDRIEAQGRRMIGDHLTEQHQAFFAQLPLLIAGSVDAHGRPWASALVGEPGFIDTSDPLRLAVTAPTVYGDPLDEALVEGAEIGLLGIEFDSRRRNRVNGRIARRGADGFEVAVTQAFGNCSKYIQARGYRLGSDIGDIGAWRPVERGAALDRDAAAMIARADTLFIASHFTGAAGAANRGVDVSHRGGKPGFALVAHETLLLIPDYAGNCMFNTLGNIEAEPKCGLLFIDFDGGDTLQLSGEAEILWGAEHSGRFPGAQRVLAFRIDETLRIERALPIAWTFEGYSPVLDTLEPDTGDGVAPEPQRPARLSSVNVSMPTDVVHDGKLVTTGIFKQPVEGRVMLRRMNLDGDGQADLWGHGGTFRAVYVYSHDNYAPWAEELGRDDFAYGQFGENFTVDGMGDDAVHVGDVYRVGGALVEVSQPRVPCYKLAIKMGIEGFQNRFLASGRVGFYLRVLEEGEVGAGDAIELVRRDPESVTVRQVNDLLYFDKENLEGTRQAFDMPALAHGWKGSFGDRLAKAVAKPRDGFRDFTVERKLPESETITSFYLTPDDGAPLADFLPGQFLSFALDMPDQPKPVLRTYSLSDAPNPARHRVSIKREPAPADRPELPAGLSSNHFHDCVEPGARLRVGAPRGKFHLDADGERALVLLSAGVGLTPMVSMLNAVVTGGSDRPVWFIHGARNGREHAMGSHVRGIAAAHDNIHAHVVYSRPDAADVVGRDHDSAGHVDVALLKRLLPFDDYDFYLCGPTPFMRALYCGLLGLGVSEDRLHYEFFGPASVLKESTEPAGHAAPTVEAELAGGVTVAFARSGVTASWDPDCESLLDLAERHGLNPDYSCRSGICHTCMCALVEGEVEYLEEPLDEPDPGCVLICCARPKTSVVIEV